MKKFIILYFVFFASLNLNSQAFTAVKIKVNDGAQGSVAELIEDHYKDANFKEGSGFNIERLWQGSGEWTHRIVFYGELGNRGRVDGDMSPFQNSSFWSNLRLYTEGHYEASSGRVLEWKEGDDEQDNFIVYDVTIKDMNAYMKAHQKFIDELSDEVITEKEHARRYEEETKKVTPSISLMYIDAASFLFLASFSSADADTNCSIKIPSLLCVLISWTSLDPLPL